MSRVCTICSAPARREIDRAVIAGESIRGLAARHNVSESAIRRHRDTHLASALGRVVEEQRLDIDAEKLQRWAGALQGKTLRLLNRAEELDDLQAARGLIREARENLVLLGRLAGELDGPTVHVDARRQVAVLGRMTDDDLRALAQASRDGRLAEAAERVGLPQAAALAGELVDGEVVE